MAAACFWLLQDPCPSPSSFHRDAITQCLRGEEGVTRAKPLHWQDMIAPQ